MIRWIPLHYHDKHSHTAIYDRFISTDILYRAGNIFFIYKKVFDEQKSHIIHLHIILARSETIPFEQRCSKQVAESRRWVECHLKAYSLERAS